VEVGDGKKKMGFKAGAFKPKITVLGQFNHDADATFTHDDAGLIPLARAAANNFFERESMLHQNADERRYRERFGRMFCMMVAKKLGIAAAPRDEMVKLQMTRVIKASIGAPSGLVPVVDGIGYIDGPQGRWRMMGAPCWTATYLGRAIARETETFGGVNQAVSRELSLFVNVAWHGAWDGLWDLARGAVNAWASTAPPYQLDVAGARVTIRPPQFEAGAVVYRALVQGCPGQTARMQRMLTICEGVEMFRAAGALLPAIQQVLNNVGVVVVDWSGEEITGLLGGYFNDVERLVSMSVSACATWASAISFGPTGNGWQLGRRPLSQAATSPVPVVGGELELGWLIMGKEVGYQLADDAWMMVGETSGVDAINKYLAGFVGKKG